MADKKSQDVIPSAVPPELRPGEAELPPPGHERREELKRRADSLMAELETVMNQLQLGGIDASKLDVDKIPREVMAAMDYANHEVYVQDKDPNFIYAWIYRDPYNKFGGREVHRLQSRGWEVVSDPLKEAWNYRSTTGERWVADCLLMRCRLDIYAQLQVQDRELRLRQQGAVTTSFFDIAERRGVRAFDEKTMPDYMRKQMESEASFRQQQRQRRRTAIPTTQSMTRAAAQQLAMDKLAQQIKSGTVAGLNVADIIRR